MDRSPLAKLPRELRDEIYSITLQSERVGEIQIDFTRSGDPKDDVLKLRIHDRNLHTVLQALTMTCKQARQEVMQIFFETNSFAFRSTILNHNSYWPNSTRSISELASLRHWIERTSSHYSDLRLRLHIQMGRITTRHLFSASVFRQWITGEIVRTVKTARSGNTLWAFSLRILPNFERQTPFRDGELSYLSNWPGCHQPSFVEFVRIPLMRPDQSIKQSLEDGKGVDANYRISKSNGLEYHAEYLKDLARVGELMKVFIDDIRKGVEESERVGKAI